MTQPIDLQTRLQSLYGDAIPSATQELFAQKPMSQFDRRQVVATLEREWRDTEHQAGRASNRLYELPRILQRYEREYKALVRRLDGYVIESNYPLPELAAMLRRKPRLIEFSVNIRC
jgi:hypothetical protein